MPMKPKLLLSSSFTRPLGVRCRGVARHRSQVRRLEARRERGEFMASIGLTPLDSSSGCGVGAPGHPRFLQGVGPRTTCLSPAPRPAQKFRFLA